MKEHFCPAEKSMIAFEKECNWCGEREPQIAFNAEVVGYVAPQRTWVGLTDEDKKQMAKEANYHWEMTAGEYAELIGHLTEAKLKEKNT